MDTVFLPPYSLNKPSEEIVRELIYFTNGVRFGKEDVSFGAPKVVEMVPYDGVLRNTQLSVFGNKQYGYSNERVIYYGRLSLASLVAKSANPIIIRRMPCYTYDILDQINFHYGVQLSEEDVQNVYYASVAGPFPLIAKPDSLVWINRIDLAVQFPSLNIQQPDLNG